MGIVTIEDVAQAAQVTPMTVSRFFRAPDKVAPATRARIEAVIDTLGYVRDGMAARMAGRAAPVLVCVLPTLSHPYAADVFGGVSGVARAADAALMLYETEFDAARQEAALADALSWRPTGVVHLGGALSGRSTRQVRAAETRFVEAWELAETPLQVSVGVSNISLAHEITGALLRAYHAPVAFALRRSGHRVEGQREAGYRAAMAKAGQTAQVIDVDAATNSYGAGAALLMAALALTPRPRALLCAGDLLAAGAVFEAQRRGLSVPDEIAIAGMGGYELGAHLVPALTTAAIPSREIGIRAAEVALGAQAEGRVPMAFRLIERGSARLG